MKTLNHLKSFTPALLACLAALVVTLLFPEFLHRSEDDSPYLLIGLGVLFLYATGYLLYRIAVIVNEYRTNKEYQ